MNAFTLSQIPCNQIAAALHATGYLDDAPISAVFQCTRHAKVAFDQVEFQVVYLCVWDDKEDGGYIEDHVYLTFDAEGRMKGEYGGNGQACPAPHITAAIEKTEHDALIEKMAQEAVTWAWDAYDDTPEEMKLSFETDALRKEAIEMAIEVMMESGDMAEEIIERGAAILVERINQL